MLDFAPEMDREGTGVEGLDGGDPALAFAQGSE
jgi:hypothetical protein